MHRLPIRYKVSHYITNTLSSSKHDVRLEDNDWKTMYLRDVGKKTEFLKLDMGPGIFLETDMGMAKNTDMRHFLKIDMRRWRPPIKGPIMAYVWGGMFLWWFNNWLIQRGG